MVSSQKACQIQFLSNPDRLRSQKWARWLLHTGLLLERICLAKTWYIQLEPNQIRAGFAQYDLGRLWKNATESERGKLVAGQLHFARTRAWWFLHTSLLLDQMSLAKPWPGRPDWTQAGFAQYDAGLLWKNRTEADAGNQARHIWSGLNLPAHWL